MTNPRQKTIEVKRLFHRNTHCLGLWFEYDPILIQDARALKARWSKTHNCWYVSEEDVPLKQLFNTFKGKAWVDASALYGGNTPQAKESSGNQNHTKQHKAPKRKYPLTKPLPAEYLEKLQRRRYSPNTINTYTTLFRDFVNYYAQYEVDTITEDQVHHYLHYLIREREISASTQNHVINAIKFYYEKVLGYPKSEYLIDRPKKEKRLPEVISREEVQQMLAATSNLKHYTIIAILYSAGLRRSELLNLRLKDINIERRQIWVRGGKGKKDRTTLLSKNLIPEIRRYQNEYKPNYWFIEGPNRKPYSAASIAAVVKNAAKNARLKKTVTPHMLRHSFATHLMDNGVDTRIIQKLLGHNSIKTTSIYTHVSQKDLQKIISPIDHILQSN